MSEAEWRRLAEKAIGRSLDSLTSFTHEGVPLAPLYPRRMRDGPRPWRQDDAWSVAQRVDHPDPEAANRLALLDLEGGADALVLVTCGSASSRGFGIAPDTSALDTALAGVELDLISLRLDAGADCTAAANALTRIVTQRRLTSAALAIDLGYDPVGVFARTGRAETPGDGARVIEAAQAGGLSGRPYLADGRVYHEAGAGEAQELGAVLATAVAYLRLLERDGTSLDEARRRVAVLLAIDADVFLGIAKMRAMRRLWARVEAASGLEPQPLRLHAETSWRMMTRADCWTNAMRTTTAAFAAGLGGADVVTVLPMTLPLGLPDDGARRLARNTQRVLLDEAHLARVEDPAAGSGAFESLTEALCERAWAQFQEIEREGGIEAALVTGGLTRRIAETAVRRAGSIATMRTGIVGTSRFPSLAPPDLAVLDVAPSPAPTVGILRSIRDAEPFEALRAGAEALAAAGRPAAVFLAGLGPPAAFGPRATAAANFFAAAGLAAEVATVQRDSDAQIEAFSTSTLTVACLCGTDAAYDAEGAALAAALRAAGAKRVLAIGGAVAPAGIDILVHDGCDAITLLGEVLDVIAQTASS